MQLRAMSVLCSQCGAAVPFSEEDRVIECPHCTICFIPDHAQGVARYYFEPRMEDPSSALHRFLLERGFARDSYEIIDVDKCFVPVWRGTGQVIGWIAGLSPFKTFEYTETVATPSGGRVAMKRKRREGGIPLKKLVRIEKDMRFTGVRRQDLKWRGEEVMNEDYAPFIRVYDQEEMAKWGNIFTPDSAPHVKRKEIRRRFIESVRSMYLGYDPLYDRLKVIGERLFLYYFPVALLKATINGKLLLFTVNGMTGRITTDASLEKKIKKKHLPHLVRDTLMVLLASLAASYLFTIDGNFAKQMAIVIIIIVLTVLWIKK